MEMDEVPEIPGLPADVGKPTLILEEDGFRVYATELAIMWRWDLYRGDSHIHTGCAQRTESCIVAARSKIRLFSRPQIATLLTDQGK